MAFLDNSGDIIMQATLTDSGRKRLAKGNFKVEYVGFGDDEINYTLYNPNHSSGVAYYDLDIVQTPVLEAFTNSNSFLKSRLRTIEIEDVLHLSILKHNTLEGSGKPLGALAGKNQNVLVVGATSLMASNFKHATTGEIQIPNWFIDGSSAKAVADTNYNYRIVVDQGLDNTALTGNDKWDGALASFQENDSLYVYIDDRAGALVKPSTPPAPAAASYVDVDDIASYFLVENEYKQRPPIGSEGASNIKGARGMRWWIYVEAASAIKNDTQFMEKYGYQISNFYYGAGSLGYANPANGNTVWAYDTTLRIVGGTTGYTIDIPLRFIRET
jgi:hypothetical protein